MVLVSLVGASPDYSASFEEFLAKFGKGYADSQEHVGLGRDKRTAKSMWVREGIRGEPTVCRFGKSWMRIYSGK